MAQTVKINGQTYNDVAEVKLPLAADVGTFATFPDTSDASAAVGDILASKTAYMGGMKKTGTMPNQGAVTGTVDTKDGTYTIPAGYHNGSGAVGIASAEKAKLIAGNIKAGVTVLGVAGDSNVVDTSGGDAAAGDVKSGKKAYVGGALVTGSLTLPTFSLTTGVLSIS